MNKLIYSSKHPVIYSCLLTPTSLIETGFSNFQILPQTLYFFLLLFVYRRGGGGRTRLLVDEEASSNSRGIGGEGSGQAAVSGGTGFQIFKFYHTLCHFFVVTDFFLAWKFLVMTLRGCRCLPKICIVYTIMYAFSHYFQSNNDFVICILLLLFFMFYKCKKM